MARGDQYRIRRLCPKIGKNIGEIFGSEPAGEREPQQPGTAEQTPEQHAAAGN
jgi:hypothetical protein